MKVQAIILAAATGITLAACAGQPTAESQNSGAVDGTASLLAAGDRVATTRWISVRATSSPTSATVGEQPAGAMGSVVAGPVITSDGLERYQVNFDAGADGWAVGKYLAFVAPAPVSSVTLTPAADTLSAGDTLRLQAVVRDNLGNVLTGRAVTWTSGAGTVASISAAGLVTAVAAGTATMTATSEGRTGTAVITVAAPPPQEPPPPVAGGLMFSSDWSTATGRTSAALLDAGKQVHWDVIAGNGVLNTVMSSAGLDFPTANVLRVSGGWRSSPAGAAAENPRLEQSRGHLRVPAIGETTSYRWYIRVVVPNSYTGDNLTHPIQDGINGQSSNWQQEVRTATNGTWTMTWNVDGGGQNDWPNNRWTLNAPLSKNQTYRVEMQIHRISATTFNLHARVYNSANQLIAGDANFRNANGTATLAGNRALRFLNVNTLAGFQAGFNGLNGGTQNMYPVPLYYQSGFVITRGGWPGAYGSVAGER
jgi:hypothetical protein